MKIPTYEDTNMTSLENKEQVFQRYIDDLRYLGAEIPMLYWEVDDNGDIYLMWFKINEELHKHLQYGDVYQDKMNRIVDYFNLSHKITDEDL